MTKFSVNSHLGSVQGLTSTKLRCLWGIALSISTVVVGCQSRPPQEQSNEPIRESDNAVVTAEKSKTSRFVPIPLDLWKTEELLGRIALDMPVMDFIHADKGILFQKAGLLPFESPLRLVVLTESSDPQGAKVEERLELFFCKTNEMPPDSSKSPYEGKLTAVAKRLTSKSVENRPPLVYILPEALKGKVCTGCAPIETASIDPPGE